jgi:hypothetical protein
MFRKTLKRKSRLMKKTMGRKGKTTKVNKKTTKVNKKTTHRRRVNNKTRKVGGDSDADKYFKSLKALYSARDKPINMRVIEYFMEDIIPIAYRKKTVSNSLNDGFNAFSIETPIIESFKKVRIDKNNIQINNFIESLKPSYDKFEDVVIINEMIAMRRTVLTVIERYQQLLEEIEYLKGLAMGNSSKAKNDQLNGKELTKKADWVKKLIQKDIKYLENYLENLVIEKGRQVVKGNVSVLKEKVEEEKVEVEKVEAEKEVEEE